MVQLCSFINQLYVGCIVKCTVRKNWPLKHRALWKWMQAAGMEKVKPCLFERTGWCWEEVARLWLGKSGLRERESASLSAHSKARPLRGCSVSRRPALGLEVKLWGCSEEQWGRSLHTHLKYCTFEHSPNHVHIAKYAVEHMDELPLQKWVYLKGWSHIASQDGLASSWCQYDL